MEMQQTENGNFIHPFYKIEIKQQEVDILSEEKMKAIAYYGIPGACLNTGAYLYLVQRRGIKMGSLLIPIGISVAFTGFYFGKLVLGPMSMKDRILKECPDGNMAKYFRAKKGEGDFPPKMS